MLLLLRVQFLGTNALFACCNMIRYLEYSSKFYTMVLTLRMSFFRVMSCIISVLPMFFGFCLTGVLLFSQYTPLVRIRSLSLSLCLYLTSRPDARSTQFKDMDQTAATLFCLLNGDSMSETFTELYNSVRFHCRWLHPCIRDG